MNELQERLLKPLATIALWVIMAMFVGMLVFVFLAGLTLATGWP